MPLAEEDRDGDGPRDSIFTASCNSSFDAGDSGKLLEDTFCVPAPALLAEAGRGGGPCVEQAHREAKTDAQLEEALDGCDACPHSTEVSEPFMAGPRGGRRGTIRAGLCTAGGL